MPGGHGMRPVLELRPQHARGFVGELGFQFMEIWAKSRCSIRFHFEVPGGKWHICRLPVGAAGGDQPGDRLLGRGEAGQGGPGLRPCGRGSSRELPVAGLQVGLGAEGEQALPGGAQLGYGRLRLAGCA